MKLITCSVPDDTAYLIPIGDIHIGDRAFGKKGRKKLLGYLDWVRERPNARIFLMGDILNCASRSSKTSPFESDSSEYRQAVEIFKPYASQILGAIQGNHERRVADQFGFDPLESICRELGVPYCGLSAAIRLRVGKRPAADWYWQTYHIYAHHTTGGGGSLGAALNRVAKLQDIIQGIDVYLGGHNHQLVNGVRTVFRPGRTDLEEHKVHYVDCGSYLEYRDSYAEAGMYSPGKLGSPRLRFSGARDHRDIHVSL